MIIDQRCGSYQWKIISDIPHEPNWPSVTNVAFRTHILFSIYLVLSVLLIGTSFLLIGKRCNRFLRKTYFLMMNAEEDVILAPIKISI